MKTPHEILTFVDPERARIALGVGPSRMRKAMRDDRLPASWLDTLERLAGRPLPREAFYFKGSGADA